MTNLKPLRDIYSNEIIEAVGLLFLAASTCESALSFQAARCMLHPNKLTNQSTFAASGMDLKVKLLVIENSVRVIAPDHADRIAKITASVRRLFQHRNNIAHNLSAVDESKLKVYVHKITSKGPAKAKVYNARQIEDFANLMGARTRQVDDCLNEIGIVRL